MTLIKIADFNPNYRQEAFDGEDIKGLDIYTTNSEDKIGSIHDVLVDDTGRFRYLVIDTGFWIFGKKVLLPVGRCRIDAVEEKIYATGLTSKEQAQSLPEYDDDMTVDYNYEERVRSIYRTPNVENSAPVEMSSPVEAARVENSAAIEMSPPIEASGVEAVSSRSVYSDNVPSSLPVYNYESEPDMYEMNEREHQKLKLYEERLVTNKTVKMTGEVSVGKRIETETATVSVPVEKERVVIERRTPQNRNAVSTSANVNLHEGEVARFEVYEETADIQKGTFVREEVSVRKEIIKDIVRGKETIRREELEVDIDGNPIVKE